MIEEKNNFGLVAYNPDLDPFIGNQSGELVTRLYEAVGGRDQELAKVLGITPQAVGEARRRERIPYNWPVTIANKLGFSIDWLVFGRGEKLRQGPERIPARAGLLRAGQRLAEYDYSGGSELCMIPKVRARIAAGTGSLEVDASVETYYAFRSSWLTSKGSARDMRLMEVTGDSMEPDIKGGDMVLIDQSQNEIMDGRVYAVGVDGAIVVKYVDAIPGKLILRSRNPANPPIEVDMRGDLADTVRIIGRVVWHCHDWR